MGKFVFLAVPMIFAAMMGCGILLIPRLRDSSMRILAIFFLLFSAIFFCPLIIDSGAAYVPKFIQDFCSLFFFVALLTIPPTLYYYVFELSIKEKEEELDIINLYFLPLCLLIINSISFIVLKKLPEDSTSFYFTVVQHVMEYSNFIAVLFLFPLMSFFYIYQSYKRYKTNRAKIMETYSYEEEVNLKWTGSFIFGYVLFIAYVYL